MFPRFKRSPAYAPGIMGYTSGSTPLECVTHIPGSESRRCFHWCARLLPRAPSPLRGATSPGVMSRASPQKALPFLLRSYGLIRPTKILPLTWISPIHQVFAGCCKPLLEVGGSRRYLHNPCIGAGTLTPPRPSGALARFFPVGIGLTLEVTRSAREKYPCMRLHQGEVSRGCSHSFMFRLPCSLGPQIAPTAVGLSPRGSRAVYATQ